LKEQSFKYEAIVICTSAGGLMALKTILSALPAHFSMPLLIVQHLAPRSEGFLAHYLNNTSAIQVKEASPYDMILAGNAFIAPPNYHMLVENDRTISLTVSQKENYARPSINVLFDSAARVYKEKLIGLILTGANNDGSQGIVQIKAAGGLTIAQDPQTAEAAIMPQMAINTKCVDKVLKLNEIANLLIALDDHPTQ